MPFASYGPFVRSGIDTGGPYSVWSAPVGWWAVLDRSGFNVMSGPGGSVFTTEEIARNLAREWNEVGA